MLAGKAMLLASCGLHHLSLGHLSSVYNADHRCHITATLLSSYHLRHSRPEAPLSALPSLVPKACKKLRFGVQPFLLFHSKMWLHFIPLPGQPKSSNVVQLLSHFQFSLTPWTTAHQTSLSFTISQSLLKLMSIESAMPSNDLILCHPFLLLPSVFPNIRLFFNQSALCIRWPKYWSFSFSIIPSNDYSGLISFRMDWLDLLFQGTLKILLLHYSLKASILWPSAWIPFSSPLKPQQ